jgi:hypothetical protein
VPHVTYARKEQKNKVSLLKPDSKEKEVKLEDFTIRIFIFLVFFMSKENTNIVCQSNAIVHLLPKYYISHDFRFRKKNLKINSGNK